MFQSIAKSALDLDALGSARALFNLRQPVDLVYTSIYVKGLLLLVPPPRSGGYDVYIHAVYVVICYMSGTWSPRSSTYRVICELVCCYMLYVWYLEPPILGVESRLRAKCRHPDSQNPHL
jgi:hypothetical protein